MCNIDAEGELWVEHGDVRLAVHRSVMNPRGHTWPLPTLAEPVRKRVSKGRIWDPPNILTVQPLSLQSS